MNEMVPDQEDQPQDKLSQVKQMAVLRPPKLRESMKNRLKSLGCQWSFPLRGWLCALHRQQEAEILLKEAGIHYTTQILPIPQGIIPSDPKLADKQTRIEILEEQLHKDEMSLLADVYQYDPNLRPEDFAEPLPEEGKTAHKLIVEKGLYDRWLDLQKTKATIEKARKELLHLSADPGEKRFHSDAPLLIAEAIIEEQFTAQGHRTLHHCSNLFLKWNGMKYVELSNGDIRQVIYAFLRDAKKIDAAGQIKDFNPNKLRVDHVVDALCALCHLNHCHASGPIWLDGRSYPDAKKIAAFQNGLLDIESWLKKETTELIAHTPLFLNVNSLEFDFIPDAQEPQEWLQFLNNLWPDDEESQQTLQEWMGYLLMQDTRYHKILLIIGPPRSGKGTMGRILHELLGRFNVVGPTLSSLGTEFGLQPLLTKVLATISDARLSNRGNNNVIIERLLSISGEDPLTINRKFLPPMTTQLPTRIMMMSNELPEMRDASCALTKRYLVLTLQQSWLGKEDTHLLSRLQKELPSILLWALEGLARLHARGKFVQPTSSTQMLEELEAVTSPIKAFVSERCKLDPLAKTFITTLFKAWLEWCSEMGYPHPGNIQSFGKNLRAAFPQLAISRPQGSSTRERWYQGIALL